MSLLSLFLLQASFTPQAWASFTRNPQDREDVLRAWCQRAGAKAHALYFALGADHDVFAIFDAPSEQVAAAFTVAVNSAGHLKSCKTTRLLTSAEAIEVMKVAGSPGLPGAEGLSRSGGKEAPMSDETPAAEPRILTGRASCGRR